MHSGNGHQDVFRPSLTEADDAVGFDRPWSPYAALWGAFFGGILAGGYLLAVNFRRLGFRNWTAPTLIGSVVLWAITTPAMEWWYLAGPADPDRRAVARFAGRVVALVVCWAFARLQRRRWRVFQTLGQTGGNVRLHGIIAVVVAWILTAAVILSMAPHTGTQGGE